MDVQDLKKNASSEQEIRNVHLCPKCGWPFSNPRPSAKHRRAHKKVCGTVEGYKLIDSGSVHSNLTGSDDKHISDDDRRNPSPNSDKSSIKESLNSGGVVLKSNPSEDELFSDAITEFSNNPSLDKNVGGGGGGKGFHVLEDSHISKGMSQPQNGQTEVEQGSIMVDEMSDKAVTRGEANQSETDKSISDHENAKVLDAVSSRTCLKSNSSLAISELIVVSDSFHDTSELIVISDNSKTDHETGKRSSSLGQYIRGNEKDDEASDDVHYTTSEVLQSEQELGIEQKLEDTGGITSGPLELEVTTTEIENEILDPQVQYDSQFKLNKVNVETSDARVVGETAHQEVLSNVLEFKYDASFQTKHQELRDALSVSEVESDSPKHLIPCSPSQSNEGCDVMDAGNESTPFLSPAETFPAEENSFVLIGDFKDYETLKTGVSLGLQAAEEDRSPDNDKTPIPENFQDALSNLLDGSVDLSYLSPLESKVDKKPISTPDAGALFVSVAQNLPSTTANIFPGTIDELKEKCVSKTLDGEVDSVVPDLPSAQSSVHAENVAFTSEKVSNLLNIKNAVSVVSARSVDNSSSDAFNGDLDNAAALTPIDGQTGMPVPENLSSGPCETEHNSSLNALQDDLKNVGTSALIGGENKSVVLTSVCPNSSMSTGTSHELLLDDLKYDLKKENFSTSISVEFIPPVPVLAHEKSKMPAGSLETITPEGMEDDLIKKIISEPIDEDADTSLRRNLPSANSSVIVGCVNSSASESVDDDLRKEVVSIPDDGEAVAAVHEGIKSSLSSAPVVVSTDKILSTALEDNHQEKGVSTLHDGNVATAVPDNPPCVLSSVSAGTEVNSSKEVYEATLNKEGVLKTGGIDIGSSGFRVTSDEGNNSFLLAGTVPSVKNPQAMMGDFEDHKVLKSRFSLDVGADDEIKLVEDDKKVNVFESPAALKDVHAENINNSLSGDLEDGFKKESVSIPIHGETDAFGFKGSSDDDSHLLSASDSSSAVDNPEALIGEFKDYKVSKSNFCLDFGAAEEIISLENYKKVSAHENLPTDNSPSDALENDIGKEGFSIPIDGEIDAFEFNTDLDLGDHLKAPSCKTNNSEPNNNAKGSLNQSIDGKSVQNEDSEPASRKESDAASLECSTGEQTLQMVILCGSGNADDHGNDKLVHLAAGNGNIQVGNEPSDSDSRTLARVETIPETTEKPVLLVRNPSLDLENSSTGFSSTSDIQTVDITTEERSANQSHPTCEFTRQLLRSDCLDEARNSHHMNVEAIASEKLYNSSESLRHAVGFLHNSEGVKMGDKTELTNSSIIPGVVSELKYEDSVQGSEQTHEGSSLMEIAAPPIESQNIIDTSVLVPLQDNVDENITKPSLSFLAVDNSTASSSLTDSLEGNWGSVSVLSIQSDVGNFANAMDTQVAEKLDDEFKNQEKRATMDSHPDKSDDVFEPPSFMTLVESGVAVGNNATGEEMQTTKANEQSKSEAQAGWFPSITNVINVSEGRKKNEEIISKVTNWSTGKQHSPLKNLLNEAQVETKVKSSSTNVKQVSAVKNQADETASASASASKSNGIKVTTTTTTVSSILESEMQEADSVKKEMEKEWNSPARYPIQVKKEKRKGKPYWVPFVCCTSVHQDV